MKRVQRNHLRIAIVIIALTITLFTNSAAGFQNAPNTFSKFWIEAGAGGTLPAEINLENANGKVGILNASGAIEMKGHPFFEPLGINPRACVTCHQPSSGMSVSVEALRERWRVTKGEDPIFAAVDGSNNPKLPQGLESSHFITFKSRTVSHRLAMASGKSQT
jgi:hypothetical protein